jgi:hypothetical protein
MQAFDDALTDATSKRFSLLRALTTEMYGLFLMAKNAHFPAKLVLAKALHLYRYERTLLRLHSVLS